jgi:hypothetical protein
LPDLNFEASLSVRLAAILLKLGSGARTEAMQAATATVNDSPPAQTKLEAVVLRFVEAWRRAEDLETGEALHILEVDPGRESAPASSAAETGLRSAWHQLQAACLFAEGPLNAVHSVLNESRNVSTRSRARACS